jgi:TonB family protein
MEILIYIAKVSAFWIALYACYWLLLRQHTFFRWNRFFLLGSLLLSFVLPLVTYPEAAPELPVYEVTAVSYVVVAAQTQTPTLLTWVNLLWALYGAGVFLMGIRLFRHFQSLRSFIRQGERIKLDECTLILMDDDQVGSFSFLNWVVISRTDYEQHFDTILTHEQVHVQQRHSLDIVLVEVLRVLFWFNPVLILYKRSLQQVHEYLADGQAILQSAVRRDQYAEFLVAYALHAPVATLTNHFFNTSLLKSRITMLYKNKNSNWSLGKYAAVALFISFVSLVVASCEREVVPTSTRDVAGKNVTGKITVEGTVKGPDGKPLQGASIMDDTQKLGTTTDREGKFKLKVPAGTDLKVAYPGVGEMDLKVNPKYKKSTFDIAMVAGGKSSVATSVPSKDGEAVKVTMQSPTIDGETIYTVVEQSPEFPGGIKAMYEFLGANIKYPEAAAKANVQGKVFLNFTITKDGEIRDIQILKGLGFGADQESIRVLSAMPRWTPGKQDGKPVNVKYNLPINFQLDVSKKDVGSTTKTGESGVSVAYNGQAKPLFIVDGKEKGTDFSVNSIDPKKIEKVNVLKGQTATDKYGEKGANGAVEITTKK